MASFGARLVGSAGQALSIAEGKTRPGGVHEVETPDVAAIHKRKKLSQSPFAERDRLSVASGRDWEKTKT